jgi:transposase
VTKAQVEVITSVERRRRWSRAEKERIVAAAIEPGAVASEVARAAGIHASQLFRWRQQLCGPAPTAPAFCPVTVRRSLERHRPWNCRRRRKRSRSSLRPARGCGSLYVFRGRRGGLIKVLWHDGQGMCLFAKRLERGRFIWPSPADGTVTITPAQLGYLLEGIDWRAPQHTWRPQAAG